METSFAVVSGHRTRAAALGFRPMEGRALPAFLTPRIWDRAFTPSRSIQSAVMPGWALNKWEFTAPPTMLLPGYRRHPRIPTSILRTAFATATSMGSLSTETAMFFSARRVAFGNPRRPPEDSAGPMFSPTTTPPLAELWDGMLLAICSMATTRIHPIRLPSGALLMTALPGRRATLEFHPV